MDFTFSASDLAFQKDVKDFLDENLSETLRAGMRASPSVFVEPDISMKWQEVLNKKGWLAYHWPKEYGGMGWTPTQRYIFEKECALADAPSLPVLGLKLLGPVICKYGTDEQRATILPRILSGEDYWCQGFSEPGAGSDLASLKTRADLVDGDYVINGSKLWTTHAHHATHMFCLARTNHEVKKQRGISFILVDMRQPGVDVRPIMSIANDHDVNEVFLDNVKTDGNNIVGEPGQGWTIAKFLLENERGGSCLAPKLLADIASIRKLAEQTADGAEKLLSDDEQFGFDLLELELQAQALEMTEIRILADISKGRTVGNNASIVKMIASTLRQKIDAAAMSAAGYMGLQLETQRPLYGNQAPEVLGTKSAQLAMPAYLNSRAWTIFGGTNEIQKTIIAKTALGL